jgi:hypothetical protein
MKKFNEKLIKPVTATPVAKTLYQTIAAQEEVKMNKGSSRTLMSPRGSELSHRNIRLVGNLNSDQNIDPHDANNMKLPYTLKLP